MISGYRSVMHMVCRGSVQDHLLLHAFNAHRFVSICRTGASIEAW
jgi:hypothetical protein